MVHCDPPKPVENRGWPLPGWVVGEPVALHAGQTWDLGAFERMRAGEYGEAATAVPDEPEHPTGVIAVVRFGESFEFDPYARARQAAMSFSEFDAETARETLDEDPWACGPHCWPVDERTVLATPVPCRGHRRLWLLPYDVKLDVCRQLAGVRAKERT
jgi:hypothetical protein